MSTRPAVAIDLGGTSIKVGLVQGLSVLVSESIAANSHEGLAPQLPRIAALIERLCALQHLAPTDCEGVGMAVPFLVDPVRQRIRSVPREKYADACDIDLPAWSRQRLGLDLRIENDAHAALLGEWRHGAGRGSDDFVMLTLGTGIGCSVLIRGRPLRGKHFQAGVLGGHLIANLEHGATQCAACPSFGCYEAESASQSVAREARKHPQFAGSALAALQTIDFAAVFTHAGQGDGVAAAVRDRCIRYWTGLIVSLVHAFDPDRVVIGGGVSEGAEARAAFPSIQQSVNRHAWIVEPIEIRSAELGNRAGMIGAATLPTERFECI
jgi:glucokinase